MCEIQKQNKNLFQGRWGLWQIGWQAKHGLPFSPLLAPSARYPCAEHSLLMIRIHCDSKSLLNELKGTSTRVPIRCQYI